MRFSSAFVFALLGVCAMAGSGRGQESALFQPSTMPGAFTLTADGMGSGASGPLFQPVGAPNGAVNVTANGSANVRANVNGRSTSNSVDVSIGFDYIQPLWSFRDFLLVVPNGFAGAFPVLGDTGHVDNHFSFAPHVKVNYYVADLDFDVSTSGTFLNLSGSIQRQRTSTAAGTGEFDASSSLTLVSANVAEISRRYAFLDLFPRKENAKDKVIDSVIDLGIGTRYASVNQNFTGTLTGGANGTNVASRHSTQTFSGIGLTAAAGWTLPCGDDWTVFSNTRGSVLVGENSRESAVSVNAAGQPGFADKLSDTKTTFIPVMELELGTEWGQDLADRLRNGEELPRFTIRVAFVGQYWGGLGPLSAASTQGFRDSDLFLLGVNVQAELRF